MAAVAATLGPQTGELDGALVGLGTRVAEERAPGLRLVRGGVAGLAVTGVGDLREQSGHFAAVLDLKVVRDVQELARLLGNGGIEPRVLVPEAIHRDAGEKVKVVSALVVGEVHAVTTHELHGRSPEGVHHVGVVELLGLFVRHGSPFLVSGRHGSARSRPVPSRPR